MPKTTDYNIITVKDLDYTKAQDELKSKIKTAIKDGWTPIGGVSVCSIQEQTGSLIGGTSVTFIMSQSTIKEEDDWYKTHST
jgi:hypothetical protein